MKIPDKTLSKQELRKFGLIFSIFIVGIFALLIPYIVNKDMSVWPWYIAAASTGLAFLFPQGLIIIYKPWMKFGAIAGWINTRIILAVLFYLIVLPTGLVMRLLGKDPMARGFDKKLASYRVTNEIQDKNHMETPY